LTHKAIVVDNKKCSGCRICEVFCSLKHEGKVFPRASRIRIFPYFPGIDIVAVCYQCENSPCVDSCSASAITRNKKTNAIVIQEELCTGCKACVETCPAQAIFMHPNKNIAIKCALCDGDPECVKNCPLGAVEYRMTPFDAKKPPEEIAKDLVTLFLTHEK
jgi:Fe-S-cluster-containing hydrogenase component 2